MEAELWKQVYKLVTKIAKGKTIMISDGYEAMLRDRRRCRKPDKKFIEIYSRHSK